MIIAGKTTLLKILGGKHMVGGKDVVRVLNSSAFHDTQLVCSGNLSYLGGSWSKTIGCAVSYFCFLCFHYLDYFTIPFILLLISLLLTSPN